VGLDPIARQEILGELMEVMQDDRRSVLFSSQNTLDVEQISDQITFIDRGRVVTSGEKEAFLDAWRRIRLSLPRGTALPEVAGVLRERGTERLAVLTASRFEPALLAELQAGGAVVEAVERMSLEEIFIATVQHRRQEKTA
jgi:ABC-2 type transport system ATP-binding protein